MAKTKKVKEESTLPSPLNNQMINYRVYYLSASEKMLYTFVTFLVGGLVGLVFYGGLFKSDGEATTATLISNIVVFLLIGCISARVFLPAIAKSLKEKREKVLRTQFKNFLETLVASIAAGNTVNDAFINSRNDLLNQYTEKDYIIKELNEIITGIENGLTIETMLVSFGERSGNEDIQNFSNVIGNCYRMGGDFKSIVRKTRDIISDKMAIADEIETSIASNKLQHNAMCIMPIILVAMLKLSSSSFSENLASVTGVFITTIAIAIFIGSYFWGRKIIDIR